MSTSWTSFRKRFGRPPEGEAVVAMQVAVVNGAAMAPAAAVAPYAPEPLARQTGTLGASGEKNERIRVRFGTLVDRLDEIRSLRDDFTSLTEPVFDLISSYP